MSRTIEEIKEDIKSVKEQCFYVEMADYINWSEYNRLTQRLNELKKELDEVENG